MTTFNPFTFLARRSIEAWLINREKIDVKAFPLEEWDESLLRPSGCFVSLKKKDGSLRGCIGTISPVYDCLADEIAANARSAATSDPRFLPMNKDELPEIVVSVDVLSPLERIHSLDMLNPKKYGIVISKGFSKGVLLPDLPGVNTVEDQIKIAMMKAGIASLEGATIERFTVRRYSESQE
ncbi:AMMECR1 domain protein [Thermovirga lienii DSM 17291]|uniref:AMMECR1 domain protein n=1 Tax=Thermovirga lienii (strain ATCC BAA-1197 / DSM 17291 / Cas60314) TaxID=580340 RepID=G7VA58_THELD|nr:AmmeMemoRadiSam system protein A [Thermovirga lienii]AER66758.1 AMMECR1 domain protein [Thermovirga lienii DSM 17291]MDN5318291.1 uncharacterized protein [Thermovirga sp.]MDN5368510.1 uncharacterized protein [Thermovirga sp.]HCD71006.1 AmmeMemoRadiSam system protein A [Thermovirga lienii]